MPFNQFYGEVDDPRELHVFQDPYSCPDYWRCRGKQGDYGISKKREEAIKIALDTWVTAGHFDRIFVHGGLGHGRYSRFIITRVKKGKPSSQFFQDSVP